jgi:hypothetical protein
MMAEVSEDRVALNLKFLEEEPSLGGDAGGLTRAG